MQQFVARDPALRFRVQRYERLGKQHHGTEEPESHRTYTLLRHTEKRICLRAQASLLYRTGGTIERRRHTFMAADGPQSNGSPAQPCQKTGQKGPSDDLPPRYRFIYGRGGIQGGCDDGGRITLRVAAENDGMLPRLDHRQHQAHSKQQMAIRQLRPRVTYAECLRQQCADGADDKHLRRPGLQVIQDDVRNHFFLRLSLSSLLISSNSSGLIFLSSTRCTSSGLADPLKTRFTKSCTIFPTTSRCVCAGV